MREWDYLRGPFAAHEYRKWFFKESWFVILVMARTFKAHCLRFMDFRAFEPDASGSYGVASRFKTCRKSLN